MGQVSSREKPPKESQESPVPTHDGTNPSTPSGNGHQQTNLPSDDDGIVAVNDEQPQPKTSPEPKDQEKGSGGQVDLTDEGPTPHPNWVQLIMDPTKLVTDCSTLELLCLLVYEFLRFWLFFRPTLRQARSLKYFAWITPFILVPAGILGLYFGLLEKDNAKPSLIVILSSCFGAFALCFLVRLFVVRVFAKKHRTATRRVNYGLSFFNLFPLFILTATVLCLFSDNETAKMYRLHLLKELKHPPNSARVTIDISQIDPATLRRLYSTLCSNYTSAASCQRS